MSQSVAAKLKAAAQELPPIDSPEFGKHFDRFGSSNVVLIGDGSHGTSEFYRARAAITQRLITKHGFNLVCIEGDWPDARHIDRFVHGQHTVKSFSQLPIFNHFPLWMWRNVEVQNFVHWLRNYNASISQAQRASFFGLDLYSMGESIKSVISYLDKVDPEIAKLARKRYGCLEPWTDDPARYGRHAFHKGYAPCESGVMKMLQELMAKRLQLAASEDANDAGKAAAFLDAEMNARLVKDSERYYRSIYYGDDKSWNLRDTHMFETLKRVMKVHPGSKAVVWAHNSHLGDARAGEMGEKRNEINLGQLCREYFEEEQQQPGSVAIIGCLTHGGDNSTVACADDWDKPMKIKRVNPSRPDSYEYMLHSVGIQSFLMDLRQGQIDEELRQELTKPTLERFIGVIYRPDTERWSHYMKSVLARQFDAVVWFDKAAPFVRLRRNSRTRRRALKTLSHLAYN